jgi:hypothetical protein
MSLSPSLKRLLVALPVTGLLVSGVGTAFAADTTDTTTRGTRPGAGTQTARPTVDDAKARCIRAIDERLTALDKLSGVVDGRAAVTDDHQATLDGQISSARDGLTALRSTIEADTDAAALKEHCTQIVTDYRVFLLVVPRTHEVVAADTIVNGADRLAARTGDLQAAIDQAEAAGKDVTHDRELFDAMQASLTAARDGAAGVPDAVIGLTVADWNSGAAKPALESGHATLRQARQDLASALSSAKQIIQDLKS